MLVKVKRLRDRGARRSDRDISADVGADGSLSMYRAGPAIELKLFGDDGSRQAPIIPILYDAQLVTMHGNKMLFQGIERTGDVAAAQYLQEWSVMVVAL
jgi:hypothetical protein